MATQDQIYAGAIALYAVINTMGDKDAAKKQLYAFAEPDKSGWLGWSKAVLDGAASLTNETGVPPNG